MLRGNEIGPIALPTVEQLVLLHTQEFIMSIFDIHTKETAQTKSAELLATAEKSYGFIPNLLGVFAESPATLKAYRTIGQMLEMPFYHPVIEEGLRTALRNAHKQLRKPMLRAA